MKKSFELLGIKNIHHGEPGQDDLIFNFTKNKKYDLCSIEVKGIEGNVKIKDLRQLTNWVDNHLEVGKQAKGLFIANTFRLKDVIESKKNRISLDSDNLNYAMKREFCVLPTVVLLEIVMKFLDGKETKLDKFEEIIMNTNGILSIHDFD